MIKINKIFFDYLEKDVRIFKKDRSLIDRYEIIKLITQTATYLKHHSLQGRPVAIFLDNDYDYFVVLISCMLTGTPYIPMRLTWPPKRIEQIRSILNFSKLIDQEVLEDISRITPSCSLEDLKKESKDLPLTTPLYIMFTSGTTGEPKGAVITRGNYENFLNWVNLSFPEITEQDKVINATDYTFDVSLMEVALTLVKNVEFHASGSSGDIMTLAEEIEKRKISIFVNVPNTILMIVQDDMMERFNFSQLRFIIAAGDRFTTKLYFTLKKNLPQATSYNCYGLTETTIYCHAHKITKNPENDIINDHVCIGEAFDGVMAKVVDESFKEIPDFKEGQLLISGKQVMEGYINGPKANAKSFVQIANENWYCTNDLSFKDHKGRYFIVGRMDDQLKVSGHRVNLTDIDCYMLKIPYIKEVATVAVPDEERGYYLIAYMVLSEDKMEKDVKKDLQDVLLKYQIPRKIFLQQIPLPLSNSGKICKKTLLNMFLKKDK